MDCSKESVRMEKLLEFQRGNGAFCGRNLGASTDCCEYLLIKFYLNLPLDLNDKKLMRGLLEFQQSDGSFVLNPGNPQGFEDASYLAQLTLEEYLKREFDFEVSQSLTKVNTFLTELRSLGFGPYQCKNVVRIWLCLFSRVSFSSFPPILKEVFAFLNPNRELKLISPWMEQASWMMTQGIREFKVKSDFTKSDPLRFLYELIEASLYQISRPLLSGLERAAELKIREYLRKRQGRYGGYFGVSLLTVYALLAMHSLGGFQDEIKRALCFLQSLQAESINQNGLIQDPFEGPVWDTAHLLCSLSSIQYQEFQKECDAALDFLEQSQLRCGGWGYQGNGDEMADFDDTAQVILALSRFRKGSPAIACARSYLRKNMNFFGGYGAWRNWAGYPAFSRVLVPQWGFFRHAFATDFASCDVSANVYQALDDRPSREKILHYLASAQDPDGSFWGRWGVNTIYASSKVVQVLSDQTQLQRKMIQKSMAYIIQFQNEDGGFSEGVASYFDDQGEHRTPSSVLQSCWALLGLMKDFRRNEFAIKKGIHFLKRQNFDSLKAEYLGVSMPPLNYAPSLHPLIGYNAVLNAYQNRVCE